MRTPKTTLNDVLKQYNLKTNPHITEKEQILNYNIVLFNLPNQTARRKVAKGVQDLYDKRTNISYFITESKEGEVIAKSIDNGLLEDQTYFILIPSEAHQEFRDNISKKYTILELSKYITD